MFEVKDGFIKPIVYVGIVNGGRLLLVDYNIAPNPTKPGWWIPAPSLKFGEDPKKAAERTAMEIGISINEFSLKGIESFVVQSSWHLICHFVIQTDSEPSLGGHIQNAKWVTAEELSVMTDIAHGNWEIGVGLSFLNG